MSERETKTPKNSVHTTIGGVNERLADLPPHEFKEVYGTFPKVAGLQQRLFGKRLHNKFDDPVMGIYQYWTPYGYGGGLYQKDGDLEHGNWTIPGPNWNIPDIPPNLNNQWIDLACPVDDHESTFLFAGDSQGIFYFAGQDYDHGNPWQNPHTTGEITLLTSRNRVGNIADLVGRTAASLSLVAGSNNYYAVDFGENHVHSITAYTVRSSTSPTGSPYIGWILQGSNDFNNWDNIDAASIFEADEWLIQYSSSGYYRFFRLLQNVGNPTFPICEWEIYGRLICHPPGEPDGGGGTPNNPSNEPSGTGGGGGGPAPGPIIVLKSIEELCLEKWYNEDSNLTDDGGAWYPPAADLPGPIALGGAAPMPDPFAGVQFSVGSFGASAEQSSGRSTALMWQSGVAGWWCKVYQNGYGKNEGVIIDMAQINLSKLLNFECIVEYSGTGIAPISSSVDITASLSSTIIAGDLLGNVGLPYANGSYGYGKIDAVTVIGFRLTYQP
jgi:hypothetical protein